MKSFKQYRSFAALLLLGLLSACSHVTNTEVQPLSGNTGNGDREGLSENEKGAIMGGAVGAAPGGIALGLVAATTCSNPFTVAICPFALGWAAAATAAGGAAGAYVGYNARTTSDYVAQDSGNVQSATGSVSTVISGQTIAQPLDKYKTNVVEIESDAETGSADMPAVADTETSDDPAEVATYPEDDTDDINAYKFFKGEKKIFGSVKTSIKKIAGIFSKKAETE